MTVTMALAVLLGAARSDLDESLEQRLQDMVWYHHFTLDEMAEATGLPEARVRAELDRLDLLNSTPAPRPPGAPLLVRPYPGGRHPRIGFRDGAVDPRVDTKISVIPPWEAAGYVVVDLPEAIWWGDRLLFLAHTHIPTLWTEAGIELEECPWVVHPDGSLSNRRRLPNGIEIFAEVVPTAEAVLMELRLSNHSDEPLTRLRAQHCVLLRGAEGFAAQSNENKVFQAPYAACRSEDGERWIVTAWEPCHRSWGNPPCPCLHSDPELPDCPPGAPVRVRGVLAFVEADDAETAIRWVEELDWQAVPLRQDR